MKKFLALAVIATLAASSVEAQELSNFNFGGRKQVVSPELITSPHLLNGLPLSMVCTSGVL